jgi:PAS domain S-box-containing protein
VDDLDHLKEVNQNLNQALQGMHALRDDMGRVMSADSPQEIIEIYFEGLAKILGVSMEKSSFYEAESSDGPYIRADGEELFVDFEMIDYLNSELKPIKFERENHQEIWLPLVRGDRILGLTQLFLEDTSHWDQSAEDRIGFYSLSVAAAFQNSKFAAEMIEHSKAVESQRTRFHSLLENVNVGLLSVDKERNLMHMNRNAAMMCRVKAFELGQKYNECFSGEVTEVFDSMLKTVENEGFVMDQQVNIGMEGGNSIAIGVNVAKLRVSDEEEGFLLTLRDMTASKELERLRKIDEMKSDFVNNVSHELRTPLTSIAAYTEALQGMLEDETHQKFLGVISSESERLLSLIENLLNVSRIESGKMTLHKELLKIEELARQVVDITKVQSEAHEVKLLADSEIPEMMMDKDKMIEVLLNIVGNAIKYSPEGGEVAIGISLKDGNVKVAISDQGIGLTPEDCQKVFDQFYRVDSSATATIGGTGLGLAITQSIVTAHGGVIQVESVLGKSTTFTIVLPSDSSGGTDEIELMDNNSIFS